MTILATVFLLYRHTTPGSDALWQTVDDRCVPAAMAGHDPKPCTAVDLAHGYALLKDKRGERQYLLIPTARVTGIEDPALLKPDVPPYFAESWSARWALEGPVGHGWPAEDIGLAVNSRYGRSQDQLHIHIDCVRADVREAVRNEFGRMTDAWAVFPEKLAGRSYLARRLDTLDGVNPFALLANEVPGAAAHMDRETLVVVGVSLGIDSREDDRQLTAFVLLADEAAGLDRAHGEELLDDTCAVAH